MPNIKHQDALQHNVALMLDIANSVGITLGPQGQDVEIYNQVGDSIFSNDGLTVLLNMAVEDPIYDNLVKTVKVQEEYCGDATTTLIVYAGELCAKGLENKLNSGIDPITTIRGYKLALDEAKKSLLKHSKTINTKNKEEIKKFVATTLSGKNTEGYDVIYDICIDAVKQTDGNLDDIHITPMPTGNIKDSKLVNGLIIDVSITHPDMPKNIKNPKILVLDQEIGQVNPAMDIKYEITNMEMLDRIAKRDQEIAEYFGNKIKSLGVNVVFCQRDINDYAVDFFRRNNILAIRNIPKELIELISRATNSVIVKNIDELTKNDLGSSEKVSVDKLAIEEYLTVENKKSNIITIMICGSGESTMAEYKRGVEDALGTVKTVLIDNRYVIGAGNIEVRLAEDLRDYARTIEDGMLRLAIEQYANCLEAIPKRLSISAGIHPLKALGKLRINRNKNYGVNVYKSEIEDMSTVIEPTRTKLHALIGATEFACDNVLRVGKILNGRLDKG